MKTEIENTGKCKVCGVIKFLVAKYLLAANINCELCSVCGQNVMSEDVCSSVDSLL